jgi:hypothetical protein
MKLPLMLHADLPFVGPWVTLQQGTWTFSEHPNVQIHDDSGSLLQGVLVLNSNTRVRASLTAKINKPITVHAEMK